MARAQVGDLGQPGLQPQAAPVDSFVAPSQTNDLVQTLKALGTVSPILDYHANRIAERDRMMQEAGAEQKIAGMTFPEQQQFVSSGQLHQFGGPWFQAAFMKSYGINAGYQLKQQITDELGAMTSDQKAQLDAQQYAAQKVQQAQQTLPQDRWAQMGLSQTVGEIMPHVISEVDQSRVQRTVEDRSVNAMATVRNALETASANGQDPAAALNDVTQQLAKGPLQLGYRDQVPILTSVAQAYSGMADKRPLMDAIGNWDRAQGVSIRERAGETWDAMERRQDIYTKRDFLKTNGDMLENLKELASSGDQTKFDWDKQKPQLQALVDQGKISWETMYGLRETFVEAQNRIQHEQLALERENASDTFKQQLSPSLALAARTGNLSQVYQPITGNIAGKKVQLTVEEAKNYATQQAEAQIRQEGTQQKLPPGQIEENVLGMYAQNGMVSPSFQSQMQVLLNASTVPGDLPKTALDTLPVLQAAQHAAPHMIDQVAVHEDQKRFLTALAVGLDMHQDPATALKNAIYRRDNAQNIAPLSGAPLNKLTEQVSKQFQDSGKFFGVFGGGTPIENPAQVNRIIQDRLNYFYATGAQGDDLVKRVTGSVLNDHVYMHGHLVDVSGTGKPAAYVEPILQEAEKAFAEAKPNVAKGGIAFYPALKGSSQFVPVTAAGVPMPQYAKTFSEMEQLYGQRVQHRLQQRAADVASHKNDLRVEPGRIYG